MEPLDTFMDIEVLEDNLPSNWQMFTLSRPTEPEQPDQRKWRKRSCSRNQRAHARGTFMVACSVGHSKPTVTSWAASQSLAPTKWAESPWEECCGQQLAPAPEFVEIMRSLHGDDPPHEAMSIPLEPAKEQGTIWITESMMSSAQFHWDSLLGATCIDVMTCSMCLVGLGVTPSADDCSMPTLLGEEDTDSDYVSPPSSNCLPW